MPNSRIQSLIENLQEGLDVEVKNWLGGLRTNEEKSTLAKEIIALANNGGGYIFIGFDDASGHPEIAPAAGELEAFTQDSIASLVNRYVTPACQCQLSFHKQPDSEISHPVITVPGEHRTPVFAKRASPDSASLQAEQVYVRRPGGLSEPARTQDDWEKLLGRLVRARQTEQLDAIREIINPAQGVLAAAPSLRDWHEESLRKWQELVAPLPTGDARKLSNGFWAFSFEISPFDVSSLSDLNEYLQREVRKYSGWPPFTYITRNPMGPVPEGNEIHAWLAGNHDPNTLSTEEDHCDFWRISKDGKGFLLRPMQEDRAHYLANRHPRPQGMFFDWALPIYRATELLKFVEGLALRFADENAQYSVLLQYHGMNGRTLQQHSFKYNLWDNARCSALMIETQQSGVVQEIGTNVTERVFALLVPVYEQFDFTALPKPLVDSVVKEALAY